MVDTVVLLFEVDYLRKRVKELEYELSWKSIKDGLPRDIITIQHLNRPQAPTDNWPKFVIVGRNTIDYRCKNWIALPEIENE